MSSNLEQTKAAKASTPAQAGTVDIEQKSAYRCVTVKFSNRTSKTLTMTGGGTWEIEGGLYNVFPPTTINPSQNVQWDEKRDLLNNCIASVTYGFGADDGQEESVYISWNNSESQENEYTVTCTPPDKYFISYTGGSGDESTINVTLYEFPYECFWYNIFSAPEYINLRVEGDPGSLTVMFGTKEQVQDPEQQWALVDPYTGWDCSNPDGTAAMGYTCFKIFNRKYQQFLSTDGIVLIVEDGSYDSKQNWTWRNADVDISRMGNALINMSYNLAVGSSGFGGAGLVPNDDSSPYWDTHQP
ncbi:hypothetical protein AB4Y89_21275 [Terriglobus sp. 2YAB30_2]|uniref:hypothetical protein n=1 Tax=unclassified Terriglobus TaxID=2628988 RepID=UPI003F9BD771